jgi:hypothetical protein
MVVFKNPENSVEVWAKWVTVAFIVLEAIFILTFLFLFYCCCCKPVERMERLEAKFGSLYEHVKYKENWVNRTIPFIFLLKRTIFVALCLYIKVEILTLMLIIKFLNLLIIVNFKPYVEEQMHKTEIMNELVAYCFFIALQG